MKYLKLFLKEQKIKTILSLVLLFGQVVGTLLIPALIAGVVDQGILKGDMDAIIRIGFQMLAVSIVTTLVSVGGSYTTADLGALFGRDMRTKLFAKSQQLSTSQFNELGVSSMITRATSDIANLQQSMGMVFQLAVPAPFIVIFAVIMTFAVSPIIGIVMIILMFIFFIFAVVILKKSNLISRSIQTRLDLINLVVRESITGVRVIRAFGHEKYEAERSSKAFTNYAENMVHLNKLFAVINPAVWLLMGLSMAVIVALGGAFVLEGTMAVGEITAVTEYAIITLSYLVLAAMVLTTLPKTMSCLERLEEVLELVPAIDDKVKTSTSFGETKYAIEFDDVTFTYADAEEPVLEKLSFSCSKGSTSAIIGSTGSGKSTVADLLLRIHDIEAGTIRLNGRDIRNFTQETLRNHIGCVPQKAFLFSGTISDNLRMGKKDATEQEMWQALKTAQAEDFVSKLPLKLEAHVSQGGTNFSGGQKQRISIARALIKKADVFIFDDSFSALDVKTDSALRNALQLEVTESAKIIIAQRVSTIMDADQILVLDEGYLVGTGTHDELMNTCIIYQDIARSQMNVKEA